nr:hypothetical protein [Acidobacteriota bacterium]
MKFSALAEAYDRVNAAGGDPARVRLLAALFRDSDRKTLEAAAHFTLSEVVAPQFSDKLGVGPGTIRAVLARLSGAAAEEIDEEVKRTGDMSEVVAGRVRGSDTLTVEELWRRANRAATRDESRESLVEHVFTHTTARGAMYFTRMALNQMRIGVGIGTLARALAEAFGVEPSAVEHLYAMTNDIGLVAARAAQG